MKLHIVHVVRDLDADSGGPSRSVPALAAAQANQPSVSVSVLFRDRGRPQVPLRNSNVNFMPLRGSIEESLETLLPNSDGEPGQSILHVQGLWSPTLHRAIRKSHVLNVPYVVSVRGMLADWALRHRQWRKRLAWHLYQARDMEKANALIGSSASERESILKRLPESRVAVIPNGCDERPAQLNDRVILPNATGARWALALGRLHPVKGYAELIEAWADLRPRGWKLAIAGPNEAGYRSFLEQKVSTKDMTDDVHFVGEVDDAAKWSLLDRCELFVAPSRTENFGMAIAEALQSGTPVVTTTGTPWWELNEHGCGWWVGPDVPALTEALKEATQVEPDELKAMGERGRALIQSRFSWSSVAEQTVALYRSILQERAGEQ